MIEKVLIINDWQEAAAKLRPPHPEAGIIAQRMAFEATTRNLSKVTFIEKPAALIVGNTVRKPSPQRQAEIDALAKLKEFRRQQAEKPAIVPVKKQAPPRLAFSWSLKPGQLFSIDGAEGIYRVITIGDGKRGRWVIAQNSKTCEPLSFHVGQFEVVMAYAEPPKVEPAPTLYDLNKVMILGSEARPNLETATFADALAFNHTAKGEQRLTVDEQVYVATREVFENHKARMEAMQDESA